MADWEDRYIGRWSDGNGTEVEVVKVGRHRFVVSYLRDGSPIARPWMNDRPSIDMPARYIENPLEGDDFVVELSGTTGDYSLHLHYEEFDYLLPENGEIISTAVSGPERYDKDLLRECSSRFLCNEHLHRLPPEASTN